MGKLLETILEQLNVGGGISLETINIIEKWSIILGIAATIICVLVAFLTKKGRIICFFTAAFNFLTIYLTPVLITSFFVVGKVLTFYKLSFDNLNNLYYSFEKIYTAISPYLLKIILYAFSAKLSFIFSLIFICKLMEVESKKFVVGALFINFIREWFITPFPLWCVFVPGGATNTSQITAAIIYMVCCVLPIIVLIVPAITTALKKNKETE